MGKRFGLCRMAAITAAVLSLALAVAGQASASLATARAGASPGRQERLIDLGGQHVMTLAQRRAEVRADTSPARLAEIARHPSFLLPRQSADGRPRPPRGEQLPAALRAAQLRSAGSQAAASSDPWFPYTSDSWLTDPAGGVADANSEDPPQSYDLVPAEFDGNVYPGETLTVTDVLWIDCDCAFEAADPPTRQVTVSWDVQCYDYLTGTSTVIVPTFGTQTVTAYPVPDPGEDYPPADVQATFTMPSTPCAPYPPEEGYPDAGTILVQGNLVIASSGNADNSSNSPFEIPGVPTSQMFGAPCAADSADPGQSAAWRGDPVNTLTGECAEIAMDAALKSPGYPLSVQRSYSSALAGTGGPLGPGWTMPWFASLSVNATTGNVTFDAENGDQYLYTSNGGGTFDAPAGAESVLQQLSSGDYTLTTPQQDVLTFSSSGQLLSEDDPTGRGLTFAYSGNQLTSVTDAAGQKVTLAYTGGLLTSITLPNSQTISYGYTGGLLTSATIPGGSSGDKTTYAYNSSSLLTTITDPDGHAIVQNTYNAQGQVTSQTDGTGAVTKFSYTTTSSGLAETDTTDPNGGIWTDLYGGSTLLETIDPLGNKTYYSYNSFLQPVQVTDPEGGITTFGYDGDGNLLTETDPLGNAQEWGYDSNNNLLTYTDANYMTTSYTYNAMDEPTSVTDQDGDETTYAYNSTGELTSSVDPRGNAAGANPAAYTTSYGYNAGGQLTSVTNPAGDKTSYAYDAMGYLTSATDPEGHVTSYTYDGDERLLSVTAPGGGVTKYGYDGDGNMTTRTDPDGNSWTYGYDGDNRLTAVTDPLGKTASYTYDGDGNQTTDTDARGIVTTTSYDADDRPVKLTYSDGTPTVTYAYDADGDITTVADGTGTRTMTYDADGELLTAAGPGSGSFTYAYDPDGNVLSRTYPDGTTVSYTYTDEEQVASMTVGSAAATTYSYDPAGNLTSTAMPDGVTETRTYNDSGQLTGITDANASATLDSYTLTLNADSQPAEAAVTQDGTAQPAQYYTYDSNGQLAAACIAASGCSAAAAGTATGTAANPAAPGAPAGLITSGLPGDCMDDYDSGTTSGTKADISACTGTAGAQQWTMQSNDTIQIHGLCLAATGTASGSTVDIATCSGSTSQEWTAGANQELVGTGSGRCLEAPSATNGTQLEIVTCANAADQHWRPPYNGLAYAGELTSGTAGDCLDNYESGTASGNKVDINTCDGGAASQLWTVQDTGAVQIAGLCLAVKGSGTASGTLVEADSCDGAANQVWAPAPYGLLVNPASDKCADAPSATSGTQLEIEPCAVAAAQEWTLPATTIPALPANVTVTAGTGSATLAWTPPASTGGSALTGYTITASGGHTASTGPYATSATVSGLTPGTAYTFTITAASGVGSDTTTATTAVTPGNQTAWTYDQAGNMLTAEADGLTTTSSYNADEELTQAVTGSTTTTYGYDADGDQTTAGADTFAYNGAGEMSKAVTPAGTFSYGYDASGDLATTSLGGTLIQGTTWDVNNPLPQAAEETSPVGATTADYAYGPAGTLASMTTPAGTYYAVTNWIGSVTGLVSSAGTQASATSYSPYGTASLTTLAAGTPVSSIAYAGSYTQPGGTGLDDMTARDYDPATGAFASVDPALAVTGQPYAYAAGAPTYLTDPSGLCTWYNLYCEAVLHWRGALQTTAFLAGAAAIMVCTAATDGLCAVAIEIGGLDVPLGPIVVSMGVNEAEGAFDYLTAGGCQPKTMNGLMTEVGEHGLVGLGEGVGEEFVPFLQPAEGEHAIPTNWLATWAEFSPVK
jgi:RHS repeat-associated protein